MIENENLKLLVDKFNENCLSHVFLIETDNKEKALTDIKEFIKIINCPENNYVSSCTKCNLCHLIATDSLPSFVVIYPDGQAIKKSQMLELKKNFTNIPYFSLYNAYIINDADKFNASSANTMLKFIEEPESHIIGFLITDNRENVINTIKSRCEIVRAFYKDVSIINKNLELEELAREYIYKLEVEKLHGIVYNKIILDKKLEKEDVLYIFKYVLQVYLQVLNQQVSMENWKFLKEIEISTLYSRISLFTEVIERLYYNVNINLLLDYFVLQLEG